MFAPAGNGTGKCVGLTGAKGLHTGGVDNNPLICNRLIRVAMTVRIPAFLQEIPGERQSAVSLLALLALLAIHAVSLVVAFLWMPKILDIDGIAALRKWLALVVLIDIAAGTMANLKAGTNAFYAKRPRHRYGFIAIHIHLPVFAPLLGLPLAPYIGVRAYTVGVALVLNLLVGHRDQRVLAGVFPAVWLMVLPALGLDPVGIMAAALFLFKLGYAFAVDHRRAGAA